MKKDINQPLNAQQPDTQNNKSQNGFVFACVAGILYIMPAVMCLAFGAMTEGMSVKFILAFVTAALSLPVSLIGLDCFKKQKNIALLYAAAGVLIAVHLAAAFFLTAWYAILAPAFILALVMIVTAKKAGIR